MTEKDESFSLEPSLTIPQVMTKFSIDAFNPEKSNWKTYLKRLNNKFALNNVAEDRKVLYLLDSIVEHVYERLCDLCEPVEPESKTFQELTEILSQFFQPSPNPISERIVFQNRIQSEGETSADFAADLKKTVKAL